MTLYSRYKAVTDYLFNQLPAFEQKGASAYKPGLHTVTRLSELFGSPHSRLRCIHVAGTNGKGSTCHSLAAVLQSAGYKVGLFTSPHLVDFRERMRIDGRMIPEQEVVDFVDRYRAMDAGLHPSFFELTTVMAFDWFARSGVDVAVIEVGLGGRLDSTNIITPCLSVITNISLDHTGLLGNTPAAIAGEKAGIIKPGVPVVIGEAGDASVREVFSRKAAEEKAPIEFAEDYRPVLSFSSSAEGGFDYLTRDFGKVHGELSGECQPLNVATVLTALVALRRQGFEISDRSVAEGMSRVGELTGLAGRWMTLGREPLRVCDTGHNPGGWRYIVDQLGAAGRQLHLVIGFVDDKDVGSILGMLAAVVPAARYYFVAPQSHRALPAASLAEMAAGYGLKGESFASVAEGYENALAAAGKGDMVFIGGSNYVVGELLAADSDQ